MKKLSFFIILFLSLSVQSVYAGGWVDDWIQQKSYSGPDYFEGQKRGYYSAGSFNTRWSSNSDYLVSVEMPRISSGCGGIDTFLGGISFMDFEYLVQKLQRILMNAGAVAFDLALNTLCEPCSTAIKSIEALGNDLNSLSLDECASAKRLVATLQERLPPKIRGEMVGEAITTSEVRQGVAKFWRSATVKSESNNNKLDKAQVDRAVAGCNAELKNTFLSNLSNSSTSLFESIGSSKYGIPSEYTDLLRGLVGDVYISSAKKGFMVVSVAPCGDNIATIYNLLNGKLQKKDKKEKCIVINDNNNNFKSYIYKNLQNINNSMITGTPLVNNESINLIKNTPIPIMLVLKTAIKQGNTKQRTLELTDLIAKSYVLQILSDLYSRGLTIASKGQEVLEKNAPPKSDQKADSCKSEIFTEDAVSGIKQLTSRLDKLRQESYKEYNLAVTQINSVLQFSKTVYEENNNKVSNNILKNF